MVKLNLNKEIEQKLLQRSKEKGFNSLEEYLNNIIKQIADKIELKKEDNTNQNNNNNNTEEEDEKRVKQRLSELGYID
jgi:hypothetical protein